MSQSQKRWLISGIIFTIIAGTLFHFFYQWSGNNPLVGVFGSVNESTWEHLKLLFWPMVFFTIFEYLAYGRGENNFIPSRVISILVGMATIVIIFYTYTGIIGDHYLIADIGTFFFAVILAYLSGSKISRSNLFRDRLAQLIAMLVLILLITAFSIFTFNPPEIAIFLDPTTGGYGID